MVSDRVQIGVKAHTLFWGYEAASPHEFKALVAGGTGIEPATCGFGVRLAVSTRVVLCPPMSLWVVVRIVVNREVTSQPVAHSGWKREQGDRLARDTQR
jgi:hypothetical protein